MTVQTERLGAGAAQEFKRQYAHADEVGAMYPLETFDEYGAYA